MVVESNQEVSEEVRRWLRMLAPVEVLPLSRWAEAHRRLESNTARPGPWDNDLVPYLVEPMDAISDPEVETVVFQGGAQLGKSEALAVNPLLWALWNGFGPILFVLPTEASRDRQQETRYRPAIRTCLGMAPKLPDSSRGMKRGLWTIGEPGKETQLLWASAKSKSDLISAPARIVILDEGGHVTFGQFQVARKRRTTFAGKRYSKEIVVGTPMGEDGAVTQLLEMSDKREWRVACEKCGERWAFVWKNVEMEDRGDATLLEHAAMLADGTRGCWVKCPACDEPHDEAARRRMTMKGEWVPTRIETKKVRGYHLPAMASLLTTLPEICAGYYQMLADGTEESRKDFQQQVKGLPWKETAAETRASDVRALVRTGMRRGVVPSSARYLVASSDVQVDCLMWVLMAWWKREDGKARAHVVDHGRMDGRAPWREFRDQVLMRRWEIEGKAGGNGAVISEFLMDSGYETNAVYGATLEWDKATATGRPRCSPVKGARTLGKGELVTEGKIKVGPHEHRLLTVATNQVKGALWNQMVLGRFEDSGEAVLTLHEEAGLDDFCEQMSSEESRIERVGKSGRPMVVWVPKSGNPANHWWDASVYATAGAMRQGYLGGVVARRKKGKVRFKKSGGGRWGAGARI